MRAIRAVPRVRGGPSSCFMEMKVSEMSLWKVTCRAFGAAAMMGLLCAAPALAEQKATLSGILIECVNEDIYCLRRADNGGVVTLLAKGEEAPMYVMRDLDTLTTMETKVSVEGVLRSPSAFAAQKGFAVRWAGKVLEVGPGTVTAEDDGGNEKGNSPPQAQAPVQPAAQKTTLDELGQMVATNQARAMALYGAAPGFTLTGKAVEITVVSDDKGNRAASVRIGPMDDGRNFNTAMWGPRIRLVCYMPLQAAASINQGQKVTVSGPIFEIGKYRYYDQIWKEWREPFLVEASPCAVSAGQ